MASKRHVSKPARDIQFVVNLKRVKKMNEKESEKNIFLKTIESANNELETRGKIKLEFQDLKDTTNVHYIFTKLYNLIKLNGRVEAELVREHYLKKIKSKRSSYFAPHTPYINDELGWEVRFFMKTGKFSDKILKSETEIDGNISDMIANASILLELGKREEANNLSDKILKKDPKNVKALSIKCLVCRDTRDYENGVIYSANILNIEPKNLQANNMHNYFLEKSNKSELLLASIDKNNFGNSNDYQNTRMKIDALIKLGKLDEAVKVSDDYLEKEPEDQTIILKKIDLLDVLERFGEILPLYDKLSQIMPPRFRHYHLKCKAEILIKMKKFEEAVSLCDESLKIKFKEYTVETKDKAQYYIDNPESRYKTNPKISPKSILTHKKVNSTNIESVGYNEDKRTLEILFRGSGVYTYFDVSKNVYQELVTSDSVGTYFHQNILNKFKYEKVDKNY